MSVRYEGAGSVCAERAAAPGPYLFVCDHAVATIPTPLADLGLGSAAAGEHIAWDIGALGLAQRLSTALDSPLVYPTVSRLVIDCNRAVDHPGLIVAETEFGPVPGNAALSPNDRQRRIAEVHEPYHSCLAAVVAERTEACIPTAVVSVHSFTPVLAGVARPWHVGLLYRDDGRLAAALAEKLATVPDLNVGFNVPYSAHSDGVFYTLGRHAEAAGLPCVMIEVRNDLIADAAGQMLWAERLASSLAELAATPAASRALQDVIRSER